MSDRTLTHADTVRLPEISKDGFLIAVKPEHVTELSALMTQHGMAHVLGRDWLFFAADSNKVRVAEILESYKNARGS